MSTTMKLTPRQQEALAGFIRTPGEFGLPDPADYVDSGTLWFRNRDAVIGALQRRGLLTDDFKPTELGRAVAGACAVLECPKLAEDFIRITVEVGGPVTTLGYCRAHHTSVSKEMLDSGCFTTEE